MSGSIIGPKFREPPLSLIYLKSLKLYVGKNVVRPDSTGGLFIMTTETYKLN